MKKFTKFLMRTAIAMVSLVVIAGVGLCVAGAVCAHINNITFAEQFQIWFANTPFVKEVVEEVVEGAKTLCRK